MKKKEVLFRCECGHPGFIAIEDFGDGDVVMSLMDRPGNLISWRFKMIFNALFKHKDYCYGEVVLSSKDIKALLKFLDKVK